MPCLGCADLQAAADDSADLCTLLDSLLLVFLVAMFTCKDRCRSSCGGATQICEKKARKLHNLLYADGKRLRTRCSAAAASSCTTALGLAFKVFEPEIAGRQHVLPNAPLSKMLPEFGRSELGLTNSSTSSSFLSVPVEQSLVAEEEAGAAEREPGRPRGRRGGSSRAPPIPPASPNLKRDKSPVNSGRLQRHLIA